MALPDIPLTLWRDYQQKLFGQAADDTESAESFRWGVDDALAQLPPSDGVDWQEEQRRAEEEQRRREEEQRRQLEEQARRDQEDYQRQDEERQLAARANELARTSSYNDPTADGTLQQPLPPPSFQDTANGLIDQAFGPEGQAPPPPPPSFADTANGMIDDAFGPTDSRDADQGPHEAAPAASGPSLADLPYPVPEQPAPLPYDTRQSDQGPHEAVAGPDQPGLLDRLGTAAADIGHTIETEGIVRPLTRPISNAIRALQGREPLTPDTEPIPSIDRAVMETAGSLRRDAGAIGEGWKGDSPLELGMGAMGAVGDLAPSTLLARQLNEMLPKADTPLGEIGAGDIVMTAALAHDAARLGYGVIKAGGRVPSWLAEAVAAGKPVTEAVGSLGRALGEELAAPAREGEQLLGSGFVPSGPGPGERIRLPDGTRAVVEEAPAAARPRTPPPEDVGYGGPGELTQLTRDQMPNRAVYEASPEVAYRVNKGGEGYMLPGGRSARGEAARAAVIDQLEPNTRIPPLPREPDMERFLDERAGLLEGMLTGETKPETHVLGSLLAIASVNRSGTGYAKTLKSLTATMGRDAEELMARVRPDIYPQAGGAKQEAGVLMRPEILWSTLAGDTTDPVMMQMLVGIARPDSFANPVARQKAVTLGVEELYRRLRGGATSGELGPTIHGDFSNPSSILGYPMVREGVPTGGGGAWHETEPERIAEMGRIARAVGGVPEAGSPYAGLTGEARRVEQIRRLIDRAPRGIGPTKTRFTASMTVLPEYATLDTRMLRDVYGLHPDMANTLTLDEYEKLSARLREIGTDTKHLYGHQWQPWSYLTGEKTTYNALSGIFENVNRFMARAEQVSHETGRPIGEVVGPLARQEQRLQIQLADPAVVQARVGLAFRPLATEAATGHEAAIQGLGAGTTGVGQLDKAFPELGKLAEDAGLTIEGRPGVGIGGWKSDDTGTYYTDRVFDLTVSGPKPAVRWFASAMMLGLKDEEAVLLTYSGAGANLEDHLGTLAAQGLTRPQMEGWSTALSDTFPGWSIRAKARRVRGQELFDIEVTSGAKTAYGGKGARLEADLRDIGQRMQEAGHEVEYRGIEPVEMEFIERPDVEEVVRGGPRGATVSRDTAAGEGTARSDAGGGSGLRAADGGEAGAGGQSAALGGDPLRGEAAPLDLGSGAVPRGGALRATLGNAAQGAFVGAASEDLQAQQEGRDSDPTTRLARAGVGAVLGVGAGRFAGRGGHQLGAGFVPKVPPSAAEVAAEAARGPARGRMLNRTLQAPGSAIPLRVQAVVKTTDPQAALRYVEDVMSAPTGVGKLAENDPRRASTINRINAGSVGNRRIETELEPAIEQAAGAGLQHELPMYLEDLHQRDILDAFFTRGRDAHLDRGNARVDAAVASGTIGPAEAARRRAAVAAGADAAGEQVMRTRQGATRDMTYEQLTARLQGQEQRLTASGQWGELQTAAQKVWDHNDLTRQRLADAGELSQAELADMRANYPHYVPTVPISHLDPKGGGGSAGAGGSVSRGTARSVRALDDVGTAGERLNPLVATRNATIRAERAIHKNTVARRFVELYDDAVATGAVAPHTGGTRSLWDGDTPVSFFHDGEPQTILVPKPVADGITTAANMGLDEFSNAYRRAVAAVSSNLTAARASFLPVNLARDLSDYATLTMAREGGPQHLPAIVGTWLSEAGPALADIARANANGRGLAGAVVGGTGGAMVGGPDTTPADRARNAAAGAVAGTFLLGANRARVTGNPVEFLARGGGSGGVNASVNAGQKWYREALRDGGAVARTPAEMARFLGDWGQDILSMRGIKAINERGELISRTAAMKRADAHGAGATEAMISGRDASYDPDRAGTLIRALNNYVPFANATTQAGAQFGRMLRDHPVAATASIAATLGPVMLAAELWNRADPARARAYDDVPQYLKDTGPVMMMPWAGRDARGSRPNYLWVPVGVLAPFVTGLRASMQHLDAVAPGIQPSAGRSDASPSPGWQAVAALDSVLSMFAPVKGDSPAGLAGAMIPPGAKQLVELGTNTDLYRGGAIQSAGADERSSAFGHAVSGAINRAGQATGVRPLQDVHPSQIDYLARQLPARGDLITGASDLVAPNGYKRAERGRVANVPFVGGVAARFDRDVGGDNLDRARDAAWTPSLSAAVVAARARPSDMNPTVPADYKDAPLTRDEQLRWQRAFNRQLPIALADARSSSDWDDPATRKEALRAAISSAREAAADEALQLSTDDIQLRSERAARLAQRSR